jgi:phage terminase small subunit
MANLTSKQEAFVREYAIDKNATQAAIRAGYSEKTAYSIGQENLNKPEIAKAITETEEGHAERCNITVDSLTEGLQKVHDAAYEAGQLAVARQSLMDQGKLLGLITDKSESEINATVRGPMVLWGQNNSMK